MDNKFLIIKCPKCGYEYLPAEIFFPKEILGNPQNIIRNDKGQIEFCTGTNFNLKEEFTCINCDCDFIADSTVKFFTTESTTPKFDEEHTTILYTDRVILEEN